MRHSLRPFKKVFLSIGAVGAAASIAGLGTFADFTSSTSASHTVSTGTLAISLGTAGTADNRLTVDATGLVPGDSVQRRVKLSNPAGSGKLNATDIKLSTSASPTSVLFTDTTDGLKVKIERCTSGSWTEAGSGPYTYTCDLVPGSGLNNGTRTEVLTDRAVKIDSPGVALSNITATTVGNTDDMVVTVRLPNSAGNTFQTQSTTITYSFTASQPANSAK